MKLHYMFLLSPYSRHYPNVLLFYQSTSKDTILYWISCTGSDPRVPERLHDGAPDLE